MLRVSTNIGRNYFGDHVEDSNNCADQTSSPLAVETMSSSPEQYVATNLVLDEIDYS